MTGFMMLTQTQLDRWVAEAKAIAHTGRIPDYIPRLAEVNCDRIAVQIQATNGQFLAAGEPTHRFALMSVVKPFVLLFLLQHLGQQTFHHVGQQPSDQTFHSLAQLTEDGGFPRNPMINSGAIALADLLPGTTGRSRCEALQHWLNHASGAELALDQAMLASVRSVGNETNRAIAQFLKQSGCLNSIETALDTYNHICCLSGTVVDLTRLGLLLATFDEKIIPANRRTVNALMLTCGLYEASGEFAVRVGLPTKSGVSGALLAVIPKQGAIACYSPALDDTGNSMAGLWLLEQLARSLNLSLFG